MKQKQTIKCYISYNSENDQSLENDFETHLAPLQQQGLIKCWSKKKLAPGAIRDEEIKKHFYTAQIIFFLVSPHFLNSADYSKDLALAIERQKTDRIHIIPILLRDCAWQSTLFGQLQPLPRNHNPVSSWKAPHAAWKDVIEELLHFCEDLGASDNKEFNQANAYPSSPTPSVPTPTPYSPKFTPRSEDIALANSLPASEAKKPEIPMRRYSWMRSFTEHSTAIWSLAFSPDGQYLASSGDNGNINVWDLFTTNNRWSLKNYSNATSALAFSPDGRYLTSGSDDGTLKIWNFSTRKLWCTFQAHTDWVSSLAFNADGLYLASGSDDGNIKIWKIADGEIKQYLKGSSEISTIAFMPGRCLLASSSAGQTVKLWDISTGKSEQLKELTARISSLAFSPQGNSLAVGHEDGSITIWETLHWKRLHTLLNLSGRIRCLAFHPDGQLLASGGDDQAIQLWNVATGTATQTLAKHTDRIESVVFSPNGRYIASGGRDTTIMLWTLL